MKKTVFVILLMFSMSLMAQVESETPKNDPSKVCCQTDRLDILWTSGEKDVFTKVVYPYSLSAGFLIYFMEDTLI